MRMLGNSHRNTRTAQLELEALEALPCGCVAAAYRALPWAINLLRLEAKGPHCFHGHHAVGHIVELGGEDPED